MRLRDLSTVFFFFNDPATTHIYTYCHTLSLHDALPIFTGASVSGTLTYWRRGGVDLQMGAVLVGGGVIGTLAGSVVFRWLQTKGQIDIAISLLYVIFLGSIGLLMLNEAWLSLYAEIGRAHV